jgi:hypothetical protein
MNELGPRTVSSHAARYGPQMVAVPRRGQKRHPARRRFPILRLTCLFPLRDEPEWQPAPYKRTVFTK